MCSPEATALLNRLARRLLESTTPFHWRWEYARNTMARELQHCQRTGGWPARPALPATETQRARLAHLSQ